MTENELIEGCKAGNRRAQKTLYEQYCKAMYTVAVRITNDQGEAEDVLQEAFLKVFTHIGRFRAESTLGAWIKTIVIRTALTKIRKQVHWEPEDKLPADQFIDWGHHLNVEYLEKAIAALPEGYRAVFTLAEVEGYAHKEIADMMGISEGTSKSQLFYAKRKLRDYLTLMEGL